MLYFELGIVTILIVTNGLLSMSELAIVSSRPARLTALAERNVKGARRALALASDPGKFLSTVQIGITLIGVLSGAFSGATLGLRLTSLLTAAGWSARRITSPNPSQRTSCCRPCSSSAPRNRRNRRDSGESYGHTKNPRCGR